MRLSLAFVILWNHYKEAYEEKFHFIETTNVSFSHIFNFSFSQAFAKAYNTTPDDLDMHVIYDVSHNIAKIENHYIDGKEKTLLVHRKGSTRAFPPHHPLIPVDYQVYIDFISNFFSKSYSLDQIIHYSNI